MIVIYTSNVSPFQQHARTKISYGNINYGYGGSTDGYILNYLHTTLFVSCSGRILNNLVWSIYLLSLELVRVTLIVIAFNKTNVNVYIIHTFFNLSFLGWVK